jgi:hypothetical protein
VVALERGTVWAEMRREEVKGARAYGKMKFAVSELRTSENPFGIPLERRILALRELFSAREFA